MVSYLVGGDHHPHGEDLEGEQAGEEEEDDGAEHHHDLLPPPGDGGRLAGARLARHGGVGAAWKYFGENIWGKINKKYFRASGIFTFLIVLFIHKFNV